MKYKKQYHFFILCNFGTIRAESRVKCVHKLYFIFLIMKYRVCHEFVNGLRKKIIKLK